MPAQYTKVAISPAPQLIVYLIDVSGSMSEDLGDARKIDIVNQCISDLFTELTVRSTKGSTVAPRYRVAIFAYSSEIYDVLDGLKPIDKIVGDQLVPQLSTLDTTDTASAFKKARDFIHSQLPHFSDGPAPLVCHLTDACYNIGGDPEPFAREIMAMKNADGNVLVENVYAGIDAGLDPSVDAKSWAGLPAGALLPNPYAQKLLSMSSDLPEAYATTLRNEEFSMKAGNRLFIPATNRGLVQLAFAASGATSVVQAASSAPQARG